MTRTLAITAALILTAGLAACGKVGQLERPGPMLGKATPVPAEGPAARPQDPNRPLETVDPRDRSNDPTPPR